MKKADEFVYLTPELFLRLDAITRSMVSKPLEVMAHDHPDMKGCFAIQPFMIGKIHFYVANQVDVKLFWAANRPELDWGAIPPHLIYDFLIWHEVGHILIGPSLTELIFPRRGNEWLRDPKNQRLVGLEMERQADRYAWEVLFPNQFLPLRSDPANLKELDAFVKKHARFYKKLAKENLEKRPRPMTSAPAAHKEDIPWAAPVARRLNFIKVVSEGLASLFISNSLEGKLDNLPGPLAWAEEMTPKLGTGVYHLESY